MIPAQLEGLEVLQPPAAGRWQSVCGGRLPHACLHVLCLSHFFPLTLLWAAVWKRIVGEMALQQFLLYCILQNNWSLIET